MADAGKRFDRKGERENRTQKLEINGAATHISKAVKGAFL
jgi:hypothetical protein